MRNALRPLALLLSVSALAGCAVGPDYKSPEIDVSSRFFGQEDVAHRDVPRKADLAAWWAGFDDPLLTRFISQALGILGLRWRLFDFGRIDAQIAAACGQAQPC